jgi:HAD superfamily phosphatase
MNKLKAEILEKTVRNKGFHGKIPKVEAAIVDVDGVLRDVSNSYRKAIKQTVGKLSGKEASDEEVAKYKSPWIDEDGKLIPGINNDWECSYYILKRERNVLPADSKKENVMKAVISTFQGFYLGEKVNGEYAGFIKNERVLTEGKQIGRLMSGYRTGIVSGAPREEIVYTLRKGDILTYFETIYSMEDLDEKEKDPKARVIKAAMRKLLSKTACYLGDGISDMKAAMAAGIVPIGILPAGIDDPTWSQKLVDAGAVAVFEDINQATDTLMEVWKSNH